MRLKTTLLFVTFFITTPHNIIHGAAEEPKFERREDYIVNDLEDIFAVLDTIAEQKNIFFTFQGENRPRLCCEINFNNESQPWSWYVHSDTIIPLLQERQLEIPSEKQFQRHKNGFFSLQQMEDIRHGVYCKFPHDRAVVNRNISSKFNYLTNLLAWATNKKLHWEQQKSAAHRKPLQPKLRQLPVPEEPTPHDTPDHDALVEKTVLSRLKQCMQGIKANEKSIETLRERIIASNAQYEYRLNALEEKFERFTLLMQRKKAASPPPDYSPQEEGQPESEEEQKKPQLRKRDRPTPKPRNEQ